jgi:hypothetical protein
VITGIEYPMRLTYVGPTPDGQLWEAHWPDGVEAPTWAMFDGMKMEHLPAHTGLTCAIAE